jgi:hypothetical protein
VAERSAALLCPLQFSRQFLRFDRTRVDSLDRSDITLVWNFLVL